MSNLQSIYIYIYTNTIIIIINIYIHIIWKNIVFRRDAHDPIIYYNFYIIIIIIFDSPIINQNKTLGIYAYIYMCMNN